MTGCFLFDDAFRGLVVSLGLFQFMAEIAVKVGIDFKDHFEVSDLPSASSQYPEPVGQPPVAVLPCFIFLWHFPQATIKASFICSHWKRLEKGISLICPLLSHQGWAIVSFSS